MTVRSCHVTYMVECSFTNSVVVGSSSVAVTETHAYPFTKILA